MRQAGLDVPGSWLSRPMTRSGVIATTNEMSGRLLACLIGEAHSAPRPRDAETAARHAGDLQAPIRPWPRGLPDRSVSTDRLHECQWCPATPDRGCEPWCGRAFAGPKSTGRSLSLYPGLADGEKGSTLSDDERSRHSGGCGQPGCGRPPRSNRTRRSCSAPTTASSLDTPFPEARLRRPSRCAGGGVVGAQSSVVSLGFLGAG